MTVITVNTKKDRLSLDQRRALTETLTDAVLVPEIGRFARPRGGASRSTSWSASRT